MQYHDGSTANLGDIVTIFMTKNNLRARIVMLGDTGEHLDLDEQFLAWIKRDKVLDASMVIVEWIEQSSLAPDDPDFAPVGDQMFTELDSDVVRVDA